MPNSFPFAQGNVELSLYLPMANRHGLIAGATGTGKTISLQVLAENFSRAGVSVFMADVKGDLSGIQLPGIESQKLKDRLQKLALPIPSFAGCPVTFWDVFGKNGHPMRSTISEMGPLLLGRLLNLNETQAGVLNVVFRVADDSGLLLLDLKDLRAMLNHVGEHASEYTTQYGNISTASVGAIQRGLLVLEEQGGAGLFGEPALNLDDLLQTDAQGKGVVNILNAATLMQAPKLYATLLLWLLSELYENLPEVGDVEKPKLVFFFDEAHLLFHEAPKVLLEKIEQVVRLVRSKGVGVYFVTQHPSDVPENVLAQLGNRIQHALRAFTPQEQKYIKSAAQTFRANPKMNVETALTELAVGEALVSVLDEQGKPTMVERVWIFPPASQMGPASAESVQKAIQSSVLYGHYEKSVDRESAYERLAQKSEKMPPPTSPQMAPASSIPATMATLLGGLGKTSRSRQGPVEAMAMSAARAIGSQVGRQIIRGVLGSLLSNRR